MNGWNTPNEAATNQRIFAEELDRDLALAFPGRHTEALCFGFPLPALDRNGHNTDVGAQADFRRFFPLRLLFGTDIPIALAQGKAVEVNHQDTYLTPRPWSLAGCDQRGRLRFTSFLNEELRATRQAALATGLSREQVSAFFSDIARALIDEIAGRVARSRLPAP